MAGGKRKSTGGGRGASAPTKRAKPGRPPSSSTSASASSPPAKAASASSSAPTSASASSSASAAAIAIAEDPREVLLSTSSSLFEYLERLPPRTLRAVYALPSPRGPLAASAVLRSSCVTDMARQIALRLVACGGSFGVGAIVGMWIGKAGRRDALLALRRMEAMAMIEPTLGLARRAGEEGDEEEDGDEVDGEGGGSSEEDDDDEKKRARLMAKDARLTPEFMAAMKLCLSTSSSSPWTAITREQIRDFKKNAGGGNNDGTEKPSRDPPSRAELEAFTQRSWDSVLHFLVGSDDVDRRDGGIDEPPEAMVQFLTRIGLMQEDPDYTGLDRSRAPLVITSKGYEFMLRDINAQVWQFVLQYMNWMATHELRDSMRIEALSLLICLGSCRVGEGFHSSVLGKNKSARTVMKDFGRFGLLYVCRVAGKTAFYPTRVAVNLVASSERAANGGGAGGGGLKSSSDASLGRSTVAATQSLEKALDAPVPSRTHLAVVVQTNFQVVAYTRSRLHVSTLGLFCDVQSYRRLPNVIFFHLTRDSVRSAFRLGVTADQILRFLRVHAHPMLRTGGGPLVPTNVRDQVTLWDRERRRVVMDEVWVHQCRDAAEFAAVSQYSGDSDALAWGAAHTNKLYIHSRRSQQVQNYIRKWRTRQLRS